jgi:hypothetical protein
MIMEVNDDPGFERKSRKIFNNAKAQDVKN